jgi:putative hemolysin
MMSHSLVKKNNMKKIFFTVAILLLAGLGCSSDEKKQPEETTTVIESNETIVETTLDQQAYVFCQQQGNTIRIAFNSAKNRHSIECVFKNGTTCTAAAFMDGTCEASLPTETYPIIAQTGEAPILGIPRFCESIATPICGVDGRTYTNACIAKQQGIAVQIEGPCIKEETDATQLNTPLEEQQSYQQQQPSSDPVVVRHPTIGQGAIIPTNPSEQPGWLDISLSLLDADNSTKQATMEKCTISGQTYYLQSERCPECFSILYTYNGDITCYPNNDLTGTCPNNFSYTRRSNICTQVWKKSIN